MIRHPPRSTLSPPPPLSGSPRPGNRTADGLVAKGGQAARQSRRDQVEMVFPLSRGVSLPDRVHFVGHLFERRGNLDRKSTRLNSSHSQISYAVFCLKKKKHF